MNNKDINVNVEERKPEQKYYEIIVNASKKLVHAKQISFEEVIVLAFGQYDSSVTVAYTVTYSYKKGHQNDKGVLVKDEFVELKEGMIFNVTRTTRS